MTDFTMMKLGRLPRPQVHSVKHLATALAIAPPPAPPATVTWSTAVTSWPVDYNDVIGDCTIAAAAHLEQAWSANATPLAPFNPTPAGILAAYEAVSGYAPSDPSNPQTNSTDLGAVVLNVLNYWQNTGICGQKIAGYAAVDVTDHQMVKTVIATFGGIYLGLRLPIAAQTSGLTWDISGGSAGVPGSWGLHAVPALDYDDAGLTVISWGEKIKMTWQAFDAWVDEAYAVVSPEFVNSSGIDPAGLTLAQLLARLPASIQGGPSAPVVTYIGGAVAPDNAPGALLTPNILLAPAGRLATGFMVVSPAGGGAAINCTISQLWSGTALSAVLLPSAMPESGCVHLATGWGGGDAKEATYVPPASGQPAPVVLSPAWQDVAVSAGAISPAPQASHGLLLTEGLISLNLVGSSSASTFTGISPGELASLEAWISSVTGEAPAVRRLYLGLLGRPGSDAEIQWYTSNLYLPAQNNLPSGSSAGTVLASTNIVQAFLGSPEFASLSAGWSASDFLSWLYVKSLGRSPSADESAWYLANMPSQVSQVLAITQSAEAITFLGYA